ncbi:SseB family protein [Micromonospora sp. CPCC 206061]|uniref:SseB family protein n=1 Tax=Micromonospora sp. CPCC 206061 TaxID=3122410 RepID=UPI002FF1CBEB
MESPVAPWEPVNDVERDLVVATGAGDLQQVMSILASAQLFLPGFRPSDAGSASGSASAQRQRIVTKERDGVPYVLVFTSPEALHRVIPADGWHPVTLAELVRRTPDGWGVAVDPATPVGVVIPPGDLKALLPQPAGMAGFVPANDTERLIREALTELAGDVLLDVLVTARVIVPTQALDIDGVPVVAVFTSPERYDDFLDGIPSPVSTVSMDLVAVLRQWPDQEHRLAVNPGSPIAIILGGERVPGLLAHAVELADRRRPATPIVVASLDEPDLPVSDNIADLLRGGG